MKKHKNRISKIVLRADNKGKSILVLLLLVTTIMLSACEGPEAETHSEEPTEETTTHVYQGGAVEKVASAADLYSLEICSYSGQFMEDNSFEEVENVAAMRLENRSSEFLDLATIIYDLGEGKEAVFEVKGLPAGETVLVLEKNRLPLTGNEFFSGYPEVSASFNKHAITSTNDISVSVKDGVLSVSNMTRKNLENVTLYYKLTETDGSFLGGVAYISSIGDLKPQETKEKDAPLFSQNAKIVKYSYQVGG